VRNLKKILIADDYKELIKLYRLMLGSSYEVIEAWDGEEAVEKYKEHNPDLAIIDIKMPKKDGTEVIKEIKALDQDANIVAITAYGYLEEALGVEVLRKGFGKKDFVELVERKLSEGGRGSISKRNGPGGGKPEAVAVDEELKIKKFSLEDVPFVALARI